MIGSWCDLDVVSRLGSIGGSGGCVDLLVVSKLRLKLGKDWDGAYPLVVVGERVIFPKLLELM